MDRSALGGSEQELQALADWVAAMATLRERLGEEGVLDADGAERLRLLTRRLQQAENRLRAIIGMAPLT